MLKTPLLALPVFACLSLAAAGARAQTSPTLPASDEPLFEEVPPEPEDEDDDPPAWGIEGPYHLHLEAVLGTGIRTDDPPQFRKVNAAGLLVGAGLRLELSRHVAVGLGYEHVGLWREDTGLLPDGTFKIGRRLDTLWPSIRLYPGRGESFGAFLDLGIGPSWQGASLTGSVWDPVRPDNRVDVDCSGSGGAGFAIRAAVGADLQIAEAFGMSAAVTLDNYRHHDDVLGDCVPGAGTVTMVGVRLGMAFGWGL